MNTPNALTLLRIIAIPFLFLCFYMPFPGHHITTAIIFALASITDWFDGYLARKWNMSSAFGAFLDPVADKLVVAVALVIIVAEHPMPMLSLPAAIIISREIVVSALREWMAELGKRASMAVSMVGKIKTGFQMWALIILLAINPDDQITWFGIIGYIFLIIAAGLTLWSMIMYLRVAWPEFEFSNN
jgi:CDP-diacylglycerol--glycerol-3-phosphate 3-phosphatidyltransferase